MVDDLGYAGPSCMPYGNPYYKTPGMDRLAREGMRFTDFHSSGTVCSPTRAGLLTGRYQQRAGIEAVIHPRADHPEHRKGLKPSEITFAEVFKEAGYATGLVGKWHLGYAKETPAYHPMNHGFDYFMGYLSGNIDYVNHWGDHMEHDWWHGRKETQEDGYTTHLINRYALEFIEQHKNRPFCLYIAHEAPHSPVQGPGDPIQRGPGTEIRTTPMDLAYQRMILAMDEGVEQVRKKIVELGLDKNTFIFFFSDNGDSPKTKTGSALYRRHKGWVYEGGTRVPAIAWWPGRIEPGSSTDALGISIDVMPTILSLAGLEAPKDHLLDGIDLSPVLLRQESLPQRMLYWASLSNNGARSEALRDGSWKLVVRHPKATPGTFENEALELYRLDQDPGEEVDLTSENPKRAAMMLKQLKYWFADIQETATPQPGGWIPKPYSKNTYFSDGDVVVFTGGSTMVKQMESGYLETLLTLAAGKQTVTFRDASWQADTVYIRQRPLNFGTHAAMLERVKATIVVAAFGQMEAMDGLSRLPEFVAAYEQILDEIQTRTKRIVLITPWSFTRLRNWPHLPDLSKHNKAITAYADAIRQLAKRRGAICIDLSRFDASGLTTDGLQLTAAGHKQWADEVARQLSGRTAARSRAGQEPLRQQIQNKNQLWKRHWRPTNWAFVYGDRQTQPSSHDHRPNHPRWFPPELASILPLIEERETRIFALRDKIER